MSEEKETETVSTREEIVSNEEREKIIELRKRVQVFAETNDYAKSNTCDQAMVRYRIDDNNNNHNQTNKTYQIQWRYLLAQNWDIEKAEKMFTESMMWRNRINMERVYNIFNSGKLENEEEKRLAKLGNNLFYGHVIGATIEDAPLLVERLGFANFKEIAKDEETLHATELAYAAYLEKAWVILAKHNKRQRGVIIVDLDGISMSLIWNISILKRVIHVGPLHYPEITKRVIIIRAPYFFTQLWGIVKRFVPKRTQHKIQVFGHNDYIDELAKITKGGVRALPPYLIPN